LKSTEFRSYLTALTLVVFVSDCLHLSFAMTTSDHNPRNYKDVARGYEKKRCKGSDGRVDPRPLCQVELIVLARIIAVPGLVFSWYIVWHHKQLDSDKKVRVQDNHRDGNSTPNNDDASTRTQFFAFQWIPDRDESFGCQKNHGP
jgi:hypothetical protein